ncbi:ABC transporter permease [Pyrinomonas sp.]|uniref:ABC transporter permease n=1 Tax=Pyrinomonas sp. TaxID=2080306 RepID=UPI00332D8C1D
MVELSRRLNEIDCIFRLHWGRVRAEAGPFVLAAVIFPTATYIFARAVADQTTAVRAGRFLVGSVVLSLSLTSISWLGYLLLENRFTGRTKLLATSPLAPSSYLFGIVAFAAVQTALGISALLLFAGLSGVQVHLAPVPFIITVLLAMLCLCGLSVVVATRARSFSEGSLLTDTLGAGLVFFAPVYYSADILPPIVRPLAEWLPTACTARALFCAFDGRAAPLPELLALAAMAGTALALGARSLRWTED